MNVAGVMSGTSADGINVALVRLAASAGGRQRPTLIAHEEYPYPAAVRRTILQMMNAESARVADLSRLNFFLGELYSDAVAKSARKHRVKLELVGCHGQTLYHQGRPERFLGRKLTATWQTGEGAIIAGRLGVPVVSDFRPADLAYGGHGAPLVPFLDYLFFCDHKVGPTAQNRIAQNIGGIANLTVLPAGASIRQVIAFDTGPGNMVIDALMEKLFGERYDRGGKIAASGQALENVITRLMRARYFAQKPPRSAGREEFGREFTARFIQLCRGASKPDVVATATAFTVRTIADGVRRFALPGFASRARGQKAEMIVSGGGAKNPTLIAMLREQLGGLEVSVTFSDKFGVPAQAKEAVAFAVMAYETWHRRASNVPAATGAKQPAILGKISYA